MKVVNSTAGRRPTLQQHQRRDVPFPIHISLLRPPPSFYVEGVKERGTRGSMLGRERERERASTKLSHTPYYPLCIVASFPPPLPPSPSFHPFSSLPSLTLFSLCFPLTPVSYARVNFHARAFPHCVLSLTLYLLSS